MLGAVELTSPDAAVTATAATAEDDGERRPTRAAWHQMTIVALTRETLSGRVREPGGRN